MTITTAKQAKRKRQRAARKRREAKSPSVGGSRVLLQPRSVSRRTSDIEAQAEGRPTVGIEAWVNARRASISRRIHPIVRLVDAGADWGAQPEPGDEIGYGMHPYRLDDCLQAAIATVTQVPIEQVPDLQLDKRSDQGDSRDEVSRTSWKRIEAWAASSHLKLVFWEGKVVPRDRWIGVCSSSGESDWVWEGRRLVRSTRATFTDHCAVMAGDRLHFDPMCSVIPPPGMTNQEFSPDEITYGISFDKEE